MAVILEFRNKETAAILVNEANPVGVQLFFVPLFCMAAKTRERIRLIKETTLSLKVRFPYLFHIKLVNLKVIVAYSEVLTRTFASPRLVFNTFTPRSDKHINSPYSITQIGYENLRKLSTLDSVLI